jgi:hypothetical protein
VTDFVSYFCFSRFLVLFFMILTCPLDTYLIAAPGSHTELSAQLNGLPVCQLRTTCSRHGTYDPPPPFDSERLILTTEPYVPATMTKEPKRMMRTLKAKMSLFLSVCLYLDSLLSQIHMTPWAILGVSVGCGGDPCHGAVGGNTTYMHSMVPRRAPMRPTRSLKNGIAMAMMKEMPQLMTTQELGGASAAVFCAQRSTYVQKTLCLIVFSDKCRLFRSRRTKTGGISLACHGGRCRVCMGTYRIWRAGGS